MRLLLTILFFTTLQAQGQALFFAHNQVAAPAGIYDADAAGYISRVEGAGGVLTPAQKDSLLAFAYRLKEAGLYDLCVEMWPIAGGNAAAHALGFKNAFNGTWTGTPTHAATGVTFNGASYLNTGANASANLTDLAHFSAYIRTEAQTGGGFGVASPSNANWMALLPWFNDGVAYPGVFASVASATRAPATTGLHLLTRSSLTAFDWYARGVNAPNSPFSRAFTARPAYSLYIGAINVGGTANYYDSREYCFASAGSAMTSQQAQAFTLLVNNLQKAFNRNSY
jgi:hypothetical protein